MRVSRGVFDPDDVRVLVVEVNGLRVGVVVFVDVRLPVVVRVPCAGDRVAVLEERAETVGRAPSPARFL